MPPKRGKSGGLVPSNAPDSPVPESSPPPTSKPQHARRWTPKEIDALMMHKATNMSWGDITDRLNSVFNTDRTLEQVKKKLYSVRWIELRGPIKNKPSAEEMEWIYAEGAKMKVAMARAGYTWDGGRGGSWESVAKVFNLRFVKNMTASEICSRFYAMPVFG